MNITLDITTYSKVYNPLSAKGQWVCHRFGERPYRNELSVQQIKKVLSELNTTHITLESIYGDPLDHSDIAEVLQLIKDHNIHCTIVTYGMSEAGVQEARKHGFSLFVKVCDKVFLGSDYNKLVDLHAAYPDTMVETTLFKHNNDDKIKKLCTEHNWQYFETTGIMLSGFCTSVIDRKGKWLYDVHSVSDSRKSTLYKSTEAWHRLKMFVKPILGKSLLDKPELVHIRNQLSAPEDNNLWITVSGHVIVGREIANIFSNALCNDWHSTMFNLEEDYDTYILLVLLHLSKLDFKSISIDDNSFTDIISSYL